MIPNQALGPAGAGLMLGATAATTLGMAVATIAAFSFFCRACGSRGVIPRSEWNGKCANCGAGLYKRDVKRTKMAAPPPPKKFPVRAPQQTALDILAERYAKGDIDETTYRRMRQVLSTQ